MFILTMIDGSQIVEGVDGINAWDDVPRDKKIAAVTLSAGGQLTRMISGYEKYSVHYEAVAPLTAIVCDKMNDIDISQNQEPIVTAQMVVALRNYSQWRGHTQGIAHTLDTELGEYVAKIESRAVKVALERERKMLKKRADNAIIKYNNMEIAILRLSFAMSYHNRRDVKIPDVIWRDGIIDESIVANDDKIKNALLA